MPKPSNTPLYVVGGCVVAIVAVVRSTASPEDKPKRGSALADLPLDGLVAPSASAPAPSTSGDMGRVQMLPIQVGGRPGLLVRYRAEVLLEPVQQQTAARILKTVQAEAEKAGVEIIVIMAVGAAATEDLGKPPPTHILAYERVADGTWVQVEEPSLGPAGAPSLSGSVPAGSGSAGPSGSSVPLFITH